MTLLNRGGGVVFSRRTTLAASVADLGTGLEWLFRFGFRTLETANIEGRREALVAGTGLRPDLLEIELTESILMGDTEHTVYMLDALSDMGVALAIDDFGTGYSSLSYLRRFSIDKLKIDRSFIKDIPPDSNSMAIAEAIIAMAHALGIRVIAEGVETGQQRDFLRRYACDEIQGYLFSPPVEGSEFLRLIADRGSPRR